MSSNSFLLLFPVTGATRREWLNRNKFDKTPLHMACIYGSVEVVQRLLRGGANASALDTTGETPFDEAFRYQRETIVVRILSILSISRYSIALFSKNMYRVSVFPAVEPYTHGVFKEA